MPPRGVARELKLESRPGAEPLHVRIARKAREERAIRAQHRVVRTLVAPDRRIEALKLARIDRDLHDAREVAVRIDAPAAHREERRRRRIGLGARLKDFADEQPDVLLDVRGEIVAVAIGAVRRRRIDIARDQRPAVRVKHPDRRDLRQRVRNRRELAVQARLAPENGLARHVAGEVLHLDEHEVDRLEHALRVLLQDIERAVDALARGRVGVVVIEPAGVDEQDQRKDDGARHHQQEKAYRGPLRRALRHDRLLPPPGADLAATAAIRNAERPRAVTFRPHMVS